jgi:hypothetical protein
MTAVGGACLTAPCDPVDQRQQRRPPQPGLLRRRKLLFRRPYEGTNLEFGSAEWLYDGLYCGRGQAENLIKLHKTQLASDRTSCRSPLANQVRLVLHTAAYWLLLTVRDAIPSPQPLATAEFATLQMRLIKIAARVIETTKRVRIAFAAACPEADLFRGIALGFQPAGP